MRIIVERKVRHTGAGSPITVEASPPQGGDESAVRGLVRERVDAIVLDLHKDLVEDEVGERKDRRLDPSATRIQAAL